MISSSVRRESVCQRPVSVCGVYAVQAMIVVMDIVAVVLGLVMFVVLYVLIFGIERI
jgi:hypothetical protein